MIVAMSSTRLHASLFQKQNPKQFEFLTKSSSYFSHHTHEFPTWTPFLLIIFLNPIELPTYYKPHFWGIIDLKIYWVANIYNILCIIFSKLCEFPTYTAFLDVIVIKPT